MTPPASPEEDPLHGNRMSRVLGLAAGPVLPHSEVEVPDHWEPPTPAHIATLLPQYQIENLIGRGGMGAVYKGRQITLNRPVAIKVLPAELARNTEFVARFHREAQLLASLSHQGIVTIFDFGQTTEGHLYFVMEYVDGTDLFRLIHKAKQPLDAKQALSLTVQICEAMQYAHDNGVVHRDIKPANVLVTKDGRAKLADFGLAMKPADPDAVPEPPKPEVYFDAQHSPNVAHLRFTQPGAAMGTPEYAAPEVYEGKADERSDIYALGIMLYEMLTGAPPKGYFQLPSVMAPVDHRVDQVVVKALEIDPAARYQKVEQMKADVQAATQPLPKAPPTPPAKPPVGATVRSAPGQPAKPPMSRPPSQPRAVPGASRQPTPKPPATKSSGAKVFALLGIVGIGAWALFHFFARTTETRSAASSVAESTAVPEFAPSNGEQWVDGLAAYWAGDWKDDTLFAREGTNGVRGLKERAVFWPLDPKTKPMRDVAIRVLWRWPDGKDSVTNRLPNEVLGVAFRSSVKSNTGTITDKLFLSGYFAGISVVNKKEVSLPSFRHVVALDAGGNEFGDVGKLKDLDLSRAHTFEVRAVGKSISFRLDGNPKEPGHDWTGDYYERGQATEGLIHGIVPQGAIIDRFEYANLDKPRFTEPPPMSPHGVTKDKPFTNSLGMKFVPVPGTKVLMCIHETRKRDYAAFAAANDKIDEAWKSPTDLGMPVSEGDDHPVAAVNSFDAEAFCQWLSKKEGLTYRLPRWMEWSWAVGTGPLEPEGATQEQLKANLAGVYPWGREWPPPKGAGNIADETLKTRNPKADIVADYNDGFATTAPAMSFPPNELGIYDLCGNVGEWVLESNSKGDQRKLRGSSFVSPKAWDQLLASVPGDGGQPSGLRIGTVGFRCVIETNESTGSVTMAPVKASSPPSIPVKEPTDATTERLNQIESQFHNAREQEARKILASKLAALNKSYATKGLPGAIADAWKRRAREDVTAVENEQNRFGSSLSVPATDPPGTSAVVVQLRDTYRKALASYEAEAASHVASTELYESYLNELNKLAHTASDPARVRARAKEVAAIGGFRIPFVGKGMPAWRQRCIDAERMAATLANGGSKETEESINRALFYLKGKQNADGSWGTSEKAGRTALALLAFLGHCETLESQSYGDTTMKAVLYLLETSRKNSEGIIAADLGSPDAAAEHGMAASALVELYEPARLGSLSLPGVRETLEKAITTIILHQRPDGGWAGMDRGQGFRPNDQEPSSIFTTAWQTQALVAARRTGLKIDKLQEALGRGDGFMRGKQWKDGGFGIARSNPDTDSILLTGAGMHSLQMTHADAATINKAVGFTSDTVLNGSFQWSTADLHSWLFYTRAFVTKGGPDWKAWNEKCLPIMLSNQNPDGSWTRGSVLFGSGDTDATALGALMMESYYRVTTPRS